MGRRARGRLVISPDAHSVTGAGTTCSLGRAAGRGARGLRPTTSSLTRAAGLTRSGVRRHRPSSHAPRSAVNSGSCSRRVGVAMRPGRPRRRHLELRTQTSEVQNRRGMQQTNREGRTRKSATRLASPDEKSVSDPKNTRLRAAEIVYCGETGSRPAMAEIRRIYFKTTKQTIDNERTRSSSSSGWRRGYPRRRMSTWKASEKWRLESGKVEWKGGKRKYW